MKAKTWILRIACLLILLPFVVWGVLSQWFGSWPAWICIALAVSYGAVQLGLLFIAPIRRVLPLSLLLFLVPLASFLLMPPSHERQWQPDVAVMPYAGIDGDRVVVHNLRNNVYRSETDYDTRFETRTYDLSKLKSMDVLLTDWGLKHIVHTMISFGFEGGDYLCLSIETRKEVGEEYSALKGFFRQYELIYTLADERDPVRLRTNFRKGEEVYLYRLRLASQENLRLTFLEFMNRINQLHAEPEWYNALTENCMTSAFRIARKHSATGRGNWHWTVVLNGYADRHAYENGVLDTSMPFEALKRASHINERARAAGDAPDFSARIRVGIPGMD
jgi:hypothetical protein